MMKRVSVLLGLLILIVGALSYHAARTEDAAGPTTITLPTPEFTSKVTVEEALQQRRSVRAYAKEALTLQQVSKLLWSAQGITEPKRGLRTAPSAMATYPLRVYLFAGNVADLPAGVYRYIPQGHKLELVAAGDQRGNVGVQPTAINAPADFLFTADTSAVAKRFGADTAKKFAYIEIGHAAQNVLLEEVALNLVGVGMAGMDPAKMKTVLKLPDTEEPVYLLSAGKKA
ncbi:MAG TPA: SagB/ThcOx family dehydrogenase [Armatimonadota bacterium]|jgi:SagB-type dehydrogenase family enzyme